MNCPSCKSEVSQQQDFCPHCGTALGAPPSVLPPDPGPSTPTWLIGVIILCVVSGIGVSAIVLLRMMLARHTVSAGAVSTAQQGLPDRAASGEATSTPELDLPPRGEIQDPKALKGDGSVYFVPIGQQAIPLEVFARHYKDKFGINVKILPAMPLPDFAHVPNSEQYFIEALAQQMRRTYAKQTGEYQAFVVGITDVDLYDKTEDEEGWTTSHLFGNTAIISTLGFRAPTPDNGPYSELQVRRTEQMLTKYIAEAHYHLPLGNDRSSLLHSPLHPDGGPDDLYTSDLHPAETPFGFSGFGDACFSYQYSYRSAKFVHDEPAVHSCTETPGPASPDTVSIAWYINFGAVLVRSVDFSVKSVPPIEMQRAYISNYLQPFTFGIGSNQTYNTWLDGTFSEIDFVDEQGSSGETFERVSPGGGLPVGTIFRDAETDDIMTWDGMHFQVKRKTGVQKQFLGCGTGTHCYWDGYMDEQGRSLIFTRDGHQNLMKLRATHDQGLDFQYDEAGRTLSAHDTKGHNFRYEYNSAGTLSKVFRPDGTVTLYTYDKTNHLTGFAVAANVHNTPKALFTNEYDDQNRIAKVSFADGRVLTVQYKGMEKDESQGAVKLEDSTGPTRFFRFDRHLYTEWDKPVQPK